MERACRNFAIATLALRVTRVKKGTQKKNDQSVNLNKYRVHRDKEKCTLFEVRKYFENIFI